jgi:hypothetical protein
MFIEIKNKNDPLLTWFVQLLSHPRPLQHPATRLQSFLSTNGVISFVISGPSNRQHSQHHSMALRLAHDLHIHHRLDATLALESEIFTKPDVPLWPEHNFVLIASPEDEILHYVLDQGKTPFRIRDDQITLNGNIVPGRDEGSFCILTGRQDTGLSKRRICSSTSPPCVSSGYDAHNYWR